jgi:hypothetical protein
VEDGNTGCRGRGKESINGHARGQTDSVVGTCFLFGENCVDIELIHTDKIFGKIMSQ